MSLRTALLGGLFFSSNALAGSVIHIDSPENNTAFLGGEDIELCVSASSYIDPILSDLELSFDTADGDVVPTPMGCAFVVLSNHDDSTIQSVRTTISYWNGPTCRVVDLTPGTYSLTALLYPEDCQGDRLDTDQEEFTVLDESRVTERSGRQVSW